MRDQIERKTASGVTIRMSGLEGLRAIFEEYDLTGFLAEYMQTGLVDKLNNRIAATYDCRPVGRVNKAFWGFGSDSDYWGTNYSAGFVNEPVTPNTPSEALICPYTKDEVDALTAVLNENTEYTYIVLLLDDAFTAFFASVEEEFGLEEVSSKHEGFADFKALAKQNLFFAEFLPNAIAAAKALKDEKASNNQIFERMLGLSFTRHSFSTGHYHGDDLVSINKCPMSRLMRPIWDQVYDIENGKVVAVECVQRAAAFPTFLLNRLKQEIKLARQVSQADGPILNRLSLP